ncbi:ATP-binding protein [Caballeronia sp. DA-9]|uniref:ATP-binding protein n=1 Tax=Caballeronia sp. DA-9 TaxID=3436237 RepID=UPI003F67F4F8
MMALAFAPATVSLNNHAFRLEKQFHKRNYRHLVVMESSIGTVGADCRFIDEKVSVLIAGPCGTGKSHLAQALGHAAARQGHDVLFMTQTRLLGALRNAQAGGSYERRFQALAKGPLLIIDDFGLKPMRTPEDEDFHDLIAERYERTSTVLTSILDFTEWGDAFATNKMLGAATLDRLRHAAYRVVLDGESYRVPRPMPESNKSALAKGGKNKDS